MTIRSDRNRATTCHLTLKTKAALRVLAEKRKMSMSALIAEAVEEMLERVEEASGRHIADE